MMWWHYCRPAHMVTITVMLIKTILTAGGQFDPGRITGAGLAGKTSQALKGIQRGLERETLRVNAVAHWQQQVILKH